MRSKNESRHSRLLFLCIFLCGCLCSVGTGLNAVPYVDRTVPEKAVEKDVGEERFFVIGDLMAYGSISDLHGGNDLWGGHFAGILAPTYKFDDNTHLILLYDGLYDSSREFYSDGIGYRQRTEFQYHSLTPMVRLDFGPGSRLSLTPMAFYRRTWNKDEADNDSWDSGIYNYEDVGTGIDFDIRECFGEYGSLKLGMQYYERRYPNYESFFYSNVTPIGDPEIKDDKDYLGIITKLEYFWIKDSGFCWGTTYSLLYKRLHHREVIESLDSISNSNERDYIHDLLFQFWYYLDDVDSGLRLGMDLSGGLFRSNQNYVDSDRDGLHFIPDYLDYDSYRIRPNVAYTFEMIPLTITASYAYERIEYTDRKAKRMVFDPGLPEWVPELKTNDQWETKDEVVFLVEFDLTREVTLLAHWQYLNMDSNNEYEGVYEYDYSLNYFMVGARLEF